MGNLSEKFNEEDRSLYYHDMKYYETVTNLGIQNNRYIKLYKKNCTVVQEFVHCSYTQDISKIYGFTNRETRLERIEFKEGYGYMALFEHMFPLANNEIRLGKNPLVSEFVPEFTRWLYEKSRLIRGVSHNTAYGNYNSGVLYEEIQDNLERLTSKCKEHEFFDKYRYIEVTKEIDWQKTYDNLIIELLDKHEDVKMM
ncbi:hypothetical protein C1646_783187 [Rhizophagus diaphanus]|nr:hypothetical protein C1646_783187 [Rhizophagus diaphanus] [Rhizophagus sp. MUCL 43196]